MESYTSCTETSSDESVGQVNKEPTTTYNCEYEGCFAVFRKSRKLLNHQRIHTKERPFVCDVIGCTKTYTNSSHLRRHKKVKHENGQRERLKCKVANCVKELNDTYSLVRHLSRAHNVNRDYPFTCFECKQGFHRKRQLQQHSYLHTGQLGFKCNICDARFSTHADCNKHKRTHTIYACECEESFERWSALQKHFKTCPQKVVEIKCDVCNKHFSTRTNLKVHKKTHADDKSKDIFICPRPDCHNYYHYKKNLVQHIKIKHDKIKKTIPCPIEGCNKSLSKMKTLKVHLEIHKNGIKRKLIRNPRKDKGIPRKKIALELVGLPELNYQATGNNISQQCGVKETPECDQIKEDHAMETYDDNDEFINRTSDDKIIEDDKITEACAIETADDIGGSINKTIEKHVVKETSDDNGGSIIKTIEKHGRSSNKTIEKHVVKEMGDDSFINKTIKAHIKEVPGNDVFINKRFKANKTIDKHVKPTSDVKNIIKTECMQRIYEAENSNEKKFEETFMKIQGKIK